MNLQNSKNIILGFNIILSFTQTGLPTNNHPFEITHAYAKELDLKIGDIFYIKPKILRTFQ